MPSHSKSREQIEELIEQGQPLVISLASRIRRSIPFRMDMDDLIAYGEVGLAEAARDFDPDKGAVFTTFAYYRVQGAIYDGLSKMSWSSRAQYRRMRFQQQAQEYLGAQAETNRAASGQGSVADDAQWLRDTTASLAIVFFANKADPASGGIRDSTLVDSNAPAAPAVIAQRELAGKLHELVKTLPKNEEALIREIYFEGATLQDAGRKLGISKSWASRLHAKALEQLARSLRRIGAEG